MLRHLVRAVHLLLATITVALGGLLGICGCDPGPDRPPVPPAHSPAPPTKAPAHKPAKAPAKTPAKAPAKTPAKAPAHKPVRHVFEPPRVVVDDSVDGVDAKEAAQVITKIIRDPRSWHRDFDFATFKIVPQSTVDKKCPDGAVACAGGYLGDVVLMSATDWRAVWPDAPAGVTLYEQRAFYTNHELGHLLGFDHAKSCEDVMRPYAFTQCKFNAWPDNR